MRGTHTSITPPRRCVTQEGGRDGGAQTERVVCPWGRAAECGRGRCTHSWRVRFCTLCVLVLGGGWSPCLAPAPYLSCRPNILSLISAACGGGCVQSHHRVCEGGEFSLVLFICFCFAHLHPLPPILASLLPSPPLSHAPLPQESRWEHPFPSEGASDLDFESHVDTSTGVTFYRNVSTGASQWDLPARGVVSPVKAPGSPVAHTGDAAASAAGAGAGAAAGAAGGEPAASVARWVGPDFFSFFLGGPLACNSSKMFCFGCSVLPVRCALKGPGRQLADRGIARGVWGGWGLGNPSNRSWAGFFSALCRYFRVVRRPPMTPCHALPCSPRGTRPSMGFRDQDVIDATRSATPPSGPSPGLFA
jgi:hypothetical protein